MGWLRWRGCQSAHLWLSFFCVSLALRSIYNSILWKCLPWIDFTGCTNHTSITDTGIRPHPACRMGTEIEKEGYCRSLTRTDHWTGSLNFSMMLHDGHCMNQGIEHSRDGLIIRSGTCIRYLLYWSEILVRQSYNVHREPNLTLYLTIQWWENWLQKCKKKVIELCLGLVIGIGKILPSIIGYAIFHISVSLEPSFCGILKLCYQDSDPPYVQLGTTMNQKVILSTYMYDFVVLWNPFTSEMRTHTTLHHVPTPYKYVLLTPWNEETSLIWTHFRGLMVSILEGG